MNRTSAARERWQRVVERQGNSGLSVAAFCRRHRVAASSLFAWKRRLGRAKGPRAGAAFVSVQPATETELNPVGSAGEAPAIELHLGGGRRLVVRRGFDGPLLREVLAVLEGRP